MPWPESIMAPTIGRGCGLKRAASISVTCWADWDQFGRWTGPKRNKEMLERYGPDLVLAFEGGKGTADMVKQAQAAGVAVRSVSKAKDW